MVSQVPINSESVSLYIFKKKKKKKLNKIWQHHFKMRVIKTTFTG